MIEADPWLAAILERDVFRVLTPDEGVAPEVLAGHEQGRPGAFYFAKVEAARTRAVESLESAGYRVVDANVTFGAAAPPPVPGASDVELVDASAVDPDAIIDVAGGCFRYSRFHLDPRFPRELADRVKREWVRNYLRGVRGDRLFVAVAEGRPAGFLAALTTGPAGAPVAVIDLVGVDPGFQRRGIGRALVQGFLAHYGSRCEAYRVGTQVANAPSIRLYQSLGFGFEHCHYVLHRHVP